MKEKMIQLALEARKMAYVPYSHYTVGPTLGRFTAAATLIAHPTVLQTVRRGLHFLRQSAKEKEILAP